MVSHSVIHKDVEMTKTNQQLFSLQNRVAIVTGGTGHLGTAFCQTLAEAGARVVVTSRSLKKHKLAAEKILETGISDFRWTIKTLSISTVMEDAINSCGRIDILVNNGTHGASNDWTTVDQQQFNDQLANASAYFLLGRLFRDHVVETKRSGSLINIGSMYGVVGSYPDAYDGICNASPASYHALKGGIIHMTRHLAVYWATDGVRVNCLSPGPFPGPNAPKEMVERLQTKSPMSRMGTPDELKEPCYYLPVMQAATSPGKTSSSTAAGRLGETALCPIWYLPIIVVLMKRHRVNAS